MKKLLLGALLALATLTASADWLYAQPDLSVLAHKDIPCGEKVTALLKANNVPDFLVWHAAKVVHEGEDQGEACWAPYNGEALVVTEGGNAARIPQSAFILLKSS